MEKLTDNRTALTKFISQNGLGILEAPQSAPSDYLKLIQFKKKLKINKEWMVLELAIIYGNKNAHGIFERFNDAIEKGNDVSVAIINKCIKNGNVLNEIITRYENKNRAILKISI